MMSFELPLSALRSYRTARFAWTEGNAARWHRPAELVLFAAIAPLLGQLLSPQDPLGLHAGFPWLALAPAIFAARYGLAWGLACVALALSALLWPWAAYAGQPVSATSLVIGSVILTVVVGDAASAWRARFQREQAENQYLRHRIKEFSRDYHVLKVSHGLLEEFLAGQRVSLREALARMKPILEGAREGNRLAQVGAELMAVFSHFGSIQVAGLYACNDKGMVDPRPLATLGGMIALPVIDPLLRVAIKEGQLASVKLDAHALEAQKSALLAVVPLVDSHGRIHGVLAVREMHFMAFQRENLNLLALLGGYVGDMLTRTRNASLANGLVSAGFLAELDSALRFANEYGVESTLVAFKLRAHAEAGAAADILGERVRSLDSSWRLTAPGGRITVLVLLPLTDVRQCEGYLTRIRKDVEERLRLPFATVVADVSSLPVQRGTQKAACLDLIQEASHGAKPAKAA